MNKLKRIMIIGIIIVAVIGAVLGVVYIKIQPGGAKAQLKASLEEWTTQWKHGDDSSLEEGLVFGKAEEESEPKEGDEIALTTEEIRVLIEERYSDIIDIETDVEPQIPTVTSVILPYTDVKYKLPEKVEDGQSVEFEIMGPDMVSIISGLDASSDQIELLAGVDSVLRTGEYETRTVGASSRIVALDDGYKLEMSFELMDALYGGMLGIVRDAIQVAE